MWCRFAIEISDGFFVISMAKLFIPMRWIAWIFVLIGICWFSGCGYTLVGHGSLPKNIKTIAIPIFDNNTLEKGIEDTITQAVIEVYVKGGKVRLVSETEADAILRGTIRAYNDKEALTYNDQNEVSSYRLTVTADIELQNLKNDEILWQTEKLVAEADFAGGPDVDITTEQENKAKALQELAKELAERVLALSTEGF
jgi:outer membrane lipopolysaccharide assembly protein LptE/RlpB